MEEKLRTYVMSLFQDAPKTKQMVEVREEILTNVWDRYHDLVASGASPEEAFEISKRSIGNLEEIMKSLEEQEAGALGALELSPEEQAARRRKAAIDGIAAALYILSPIFVITLSAAGYWMWGLVGLFICIAVATGLKVYSSGTYQQQYRRVDDSMVEEFKEWKSGQADRKRQEKLYEGIMWPLIVAAYFIISFMTQAWYITWVIFLIGAAVNQLLKVIMER